MYCKCRIKRSKHNGLNLAAEKALPEFQCPWVCISSCVLLPDDTLKTCVQSILNILLLLIHILTVLFVRDCLAFISVCALVLLFVLLIHILHSFIQSYPNVKRYLSVWELASMIWVKCVCFNIEVNLFVVRLLSDNDFTLLVRWLLLKYKFLCLFFVSFDLKKFDLNGFVHILNLWNSTFWINNNKNMIFWCLYLMRLWWKLTLRRILIFHIEYSVIAHVYSWYFSAATGWIVPC